MTDKSALLNQLRIDRAPPRDTNRSWLLWSLAAITVLAAAGAGAWYALGSAGTLHVRAGVAQVAAATGNPAGGGALLDASGYIVARRSATVAAKITDRVVQVLIEEGQHVEADEIIARLDDTNTNAALSLAKAQVAQAQASVNAARIAAQDAAPLYQRQQKLVAQGWTSAETFDTTRANYDAAQTNLLVQQQVLASTQASVEVAQRNQDDTIVRAPFAGVITVKAAQPGEIVSPISAGGGFTRTGIGTIVDMDSLEVEIDVSESFINRVHPNQAATIKLNAYPDWQIPGEVITVIPTADRSKATVKVRVRILAKDPRILPEMGARVQFLSDAPAAALAGAPAKLGVVVPSEAVQAKGDTGTVYLIHGGTLERRTIRLGARSSDSQTVLSGLAPGDRLAIADFAKLTDGAAVTVDP
ncbi:MAG: efflux RND transporter periplasmic adaptor subunit [Aliidongia sp.]